MKTARSWQRKACGTTDYWHGTLARRNAFLTCPSSFSQASDVGTDGRILFTTLHDGDVVISELTPGGCRALAQTLHVPSGPWGKVSVSPEGRIVAFSGVTRLGNMGLQDETTALGIGPSVRCSADFDDAGRLIVGCQSGTYRLSRRVEMIASLAAAPAVAAKSAHGRTVVQFGSAERLTGSIEPSSLAVNAKGETLVGQDTSGWFVLHPGKNSTRIRLEPKPDPRKARSAMTTATRQSPVGSAAVQRFGTPGPETKLTDLAVGRHGLVQFSPDGQYLAATPDGVALWRTSDWRRTSQLHSQGTTPAGLGIAFSPDSRILAVGQVNGVVALVDPQTGDEWARLSDRDVSVASIMSFSPDQRCLITSSVDQRSPAQVWDLTAMRRELRDRGLDWPADVLRAATSEKSFEEQIEIVLDDVGVSDELLQPSVLHDRAPR